MNMNEINHIMEDKRFHKTIPKRLDLLQEQSMFTTIVLDDQTKLDFFVKHKKFNTKADGKYTLVAFVLVDIVTKL